MDPMWTDGGFLLALNRYGYDVTDGPAAVRAFQRRFRPERVDGVICGHIHTAAIRDDHGIRYMNCGDWVESCTALAEHEDGRFEIITWTDPLRVTAPVVAVAARAA